MADGPDLEAIQKNIESAINGAEVEVTTDGYYYNVAVVSQAFDGLRAVARQQLVYKALAGYIADGSIHAVNIKASTPDEV